MACLVGFSVAIMKSLHRRYELQFSDDPQNWWPFPANRLTGRSQTKCCNGRDLFHTPPSAASATACNSSGSECQGSSPAAPRLKCCRGDSWASCACCCLALTGRVCITRSICTPHQRETLLHKLKIPYFTGSQQKKGTLVHCAATMCCSTRCRFASFATGYLLAAA